jgi:hypothetical protein
MRMQAPLLRTMAEVIAAWSWIEFNVPPSTCQALIISTRAVEYVGLCVNQGKNMHVIDTQQSPKSTVDGSAIKSHSS